MYAFYITHARGNKRGQVTDFRIFDDYDKAVRHANIMTGCWSVPFMEPCTLGDKPIMPCHITDGDYEFLGHFQKVEFDTDIRIYTIQQD